MLAASFRLLALLSAAGAPAIELSRLLDVTSAFLNDIEKVIEDIQMLACAIA